MGIFSALRDALFVTGRTKRLDEMILPRYGWAWSRFVRERFTRSHTRTGKCHSQNVVLFQFAYGSWRISRSSLLIFIRKVTLLQSTFLQEQFANISDSTGKPERCGGKGKIRTRSNNIIDFFERVEASAQFAVPRISAAFQIEQQ